MIEIPINRENLLIFIKNIRAQDKEELSYVFKENLEENFINSCLNCNEIYFLADKDKMPVAIGGVEKRIYQDKSLGQVWLLVTDLYYKNRFYLYKYVLNKIEKFKTQFDILFNFIYKSNFSALNWLNRAGFSEFCLPNQDFKLFYFVNGGNEFDIRYFTCE